MRLQKTVGGSVTTPAAKPLGPNLSSAANILSAPALPIGAEVVDFRGYFKVEVFPHNAVIYRPGDSSDRVYLLKRGRVRLIRTGRNAARSVLAILRGGDLFGEVSLGESGATEELAVASGETEVWSIEGSEFKDLLESRPSLSTDIIRAQNERIRHMRRRLLGLTFKEVPARLAETLLTLGESLGERCPHGGEVDLRGVTQQDLADLVGASRSFVSTLINEMKRDGYLGNVGRILCIRDQKSLRKIASKEK
ncbi:MAG TPA: Crp/Fnr family transcriptional regulator [Myxococcales bacterium]|jgi:CRP-like cAMP-binding protein|nr:Crp/Fnr family transcriptional regulator [Myxococcales bacterium]